jgi:hypothetical protein
VTVNPALLKQSFVYPATSFRMKLLVLRFLVFFSKLIQSFFPGLIVLTGNAFPRAAGS